MFCCVELQMYLQQAQELVLLETIVLQTLGKWRSVNESVLLPDGEHMSPV